MAARSLIGVNARTGFRAMLGANLVEESGLSIHGWARGALEADLQGAEALGYDRLLALRALLAEIVEQSRGLRDPEELAHELQFLADNLDDERDYAFMRP